MASQSSTGRLDELRAKYGDRIRRQMADGVVSDRDAALATVKSVRRQVERVMDVDPQMQQLLKDGDTMTYGFIFDARMKARLGVSGGQTGPVPGLSGTHAVIRPGGRNGVQGDYRMPDLRYDGVNGTEYWDIKPSALTWNHQFQDILNWGSSNVFRI